MLLKNYPHQNLHIILFLLSQESWKKKGFVEHETFGNTHRYFPTVSKKDYTKGFLKGFVKNYFENSYRQMVSFFTKENNLNLNELEDIRQLIDSQIRTKKEKKP